MTENITIVIENVRDIPRFHALRQVDGETPEEVARRYPGCTMYMLDHDYTLRVWVDVTQQEEPCQT